MFALLKIALIYKALKLFVHLQGPICYKDSQNKGINLGGTQPLFSLKYLFGKANIA